MRGEPKQVIVMRKDLNMRKGKMVAQGCHASLAVLLNLGQMHRTMSDLDGKLHQIDFNIPLYYEDRFPFTGKHDARNYQGIIDWIEGRFTKICVSVNSEEELLKVHQAAVDAGLPCALITDAGLTEFNGVPTKTCCAIGPDMPDRIDAITGDLKLL